MKTQKPKPAMPSLETIQQELGKAQSMDDFFGKEGIFARLFAKTEGDCAGDGVCV